MAEGRMLKKVICESPKLAALKNDTHRLIYTWLIPHLDIEGRHHADPRIVKSHVAPILDHITNKVIIAALNDMAKNDLITLYSANGKQYLELCLFKKHQNLRTDRERESDIPAPGLLPESSVITPIQDKIREDKISKDKAQKFVLPTWCTPKLWDAYLEVRKKKRATLEETALSLSIKNIEKLAVDTKTRVLILEQSIQRGWVGFFELKEDKHGQGFKRDFRQGDVARPDPPAEAIDAIERARERKRLRDQGAHKSPVNSNNENA